MTKPVYRPEIRVHREGSGMNYEDTKMAFTLIVWRLLRYARNDIPLRVIGVDCHCEERSDVAISSDHLRVSVLCVFVVKFFRREEP